MAHAALFRDTGLHLLPARLSRAAGAVALDHPRAPRHDLARAELRLRAMRTQDRGGGSRRTRLELVARGFKRRGADSPRNPRSLSTKARTLRFSQGEFPAGLWTRRVFTIAFVGKAWDRPAHRGVRAGAARERGDGIARTCGRSIGSSSRGRRQGGPATRDPHRRRRWTRCSGGTRGLSHLSRTLRDERVLQEGRRHSCHPPRRRLSRFGRSRVRARRRAFHHRPLQRHHHPRRP